MVIVMLLLSVLANTISQLCLKRGITTLRATVSQRFTVPSLLYHTLSNPFIVIWALLTVFAMFLWLKAISMTELSFAYPFLSLSLVLISLGSIVFLRERMTARQWSGVALILVGIVLTSRS